MANGIQNLDPNLWEKIKRLMNPIDDKGQMKTGGMNMSPEDARFAAELGLDFTPGVGDVKALLYDMPRSLRDARNAPTPLGKAGHVGLATLAGLSAIPFLGMPADALRAGIKALRKYTKKRPTPNEMLSKAPTQAQINEMGLSGDADYTMDFMTQGQRPPKTDAELRAKWGRPERPAWESDPDAWRDARRDGSGGEGIGPTYKMTMDDTGAMRPGNWRHGQQQLNRYDDWDTPHLLRRLAEEVPESQRMDPAVLEEIVENLQDLYPRHVATVRENYVKGIDTPELMETMRFPRGQGKIYRKLYEMMQP
jgi:hypothetical protein